MIGAAKKNKKLGNKPTQKPREERKGELSSRYQDESDEEDDTIGKLQKELDDIKSGDPEDKDFEGGEDSDLQHLLSDTNVGEDEGESANEERNEAEEYEYLLTRYTSKLFMRDLINVLKFDTTEVSENCPKLVRMRFRLFDESLQRKAHFYEHIIHLAHGFCRSGFLKIITHDG